MRQSKLINKKSIYTNFNNILRASDVFNTDPVVVQIELIVFANQSCSEMIWAVVDDGAQLVSSCHQWFTCRSRHCEDKQTYFASPIEITRFKSSRRTLRSNRWLAFFLFLSGMMSARMMRGSPLSNIAAVVVVCPLHTRQSLQWYTWCNAKQRKKQRTRSLLGLIVHRRL